MKALFSGVAPGRAWNAGTSSLMSPSQPFSSPQLIEIRLSTERTPPVPTTPSHRTVCGAPYSPLNFMPAVKPKGLAA